MNLGSEPRMTEAVLPGEPAASRRLFSGRTQYTIGEGKRTALALALLALLPFAVSLPVMIYQRIIHGLLFDIPGLLILSLCLLFVMALLIAELTHAVRSRVLVGERAFTFTLPRGRGSAPMLRYMRQTIPYSEIAEIELRRELFGGALMPVVLQGAHVITKKGIDVRLGYVSETYPDDDFPFDRIARQLAERAAVPLIEEEGVWRTLHSKAQARAAGLIAGDAKRVEPAELERLRRNHRRFGLAVVNIVLAVVLVGIAMDVAGGSRAIPAPGQPAADAGERMSGAPDAK